VWGALHYAVRHGDSDDQDPASQEVHPVSQVLEFHPAFGKEMVDEDVEAVWEVLSQDEVQEVIPVMEPVIEAITTEGDKKLDVMEGGKVKAEASCGNDDNLPEGWKNGGDKKLFLREPGEVKDESSKDDEDLHDG
jgi:hypothetical protein